MRDTNDIPDPDALSEGASLRARADGEIGPGADQADDPRVRFERALRERVARAMDEPSRAPAAVRGEVERMLAAQRAVERESDGVVRPASGGDTRTRSFWNTVSVVMAVAAVLALGATLVIMALPGTGAGSLSFPAGAMGRAASFVSSEHARCGDFGSVFEQKMTARTQAEAIREAVEILRVIPDAVDLPVRGLDAAGYEFAGLGECAVPGSGRSVHLLYRSATPGALPLSLFIQQDTGELEMDPAACYVCTADAACETVRGEIERGELHKPEVVIWKRDGLVYYLYVPARPETDEPIRRALDVPATRLPFIQA